MSLQIPLSQVGDAESFRKRVEVFQAKIDHQKTLDMPAPQEHHLVEAVVRRVPRGHLSISAPLAAERGASVAARQSVATAILSHFQ